MMKTDEELSRLAEAALLQEAKRGALRAEMAGPSGWLKPKLPSTNKLFLHNTIRGAVASNQAKDKKRKKIKETKLENFERELEEKRRYKKCYLKASTKLKDKDSKPLPNKLNSEKSASKSVNGIAWKDDGLEISCAIPTEKKNIKPSKTKSNVLIRNIKFISESKTRQLDVT